ncbi:MAG: NUDIX hydrolase [Chloroflexota bacterium]
MQTWKTNRRQTILKPQDGRFLTVEYHEVELPDGTIIDDWPWLITPDFINVVLVTESGKFVCFRQTKYAIEGTSLAIVGGYLEPGEDSLAAAKREVLEETGYEAPDWIKLGSFPVDGNRGAGTAHFFLAQNARWVKEINADDLEEQELLLLTREEVGHSLQNGEFKVLPWAAIVALALMQLDSLK